MKTIQSEKLSKKQKEIIIKAFHDPLILSKINTSDIDILKNLKLVNTNFGSSTNNIYSLSEEGMQYAKILIDEKNVRRKDMFFQWITLLISLSALFLSIFNTYNDTKKEEPRSSEYTSIINS